MRLSENEKKFLEAIRDNAFTTVSQVAQACGFNRAMGYHYYRSLYLGGLVEGFEPTYAGHKMLEGEELTTSDDEHMVDIRISRATEHRID